MKPLILLFLLAGISVLEITNPPWGKWVFIVLGGVFGLYVCARLVTAAYFESKRQYDERKLP